MGVSSSALKLYDYAQMSNSPQAKAVTFSLIDNGSIMARDIPFRTFESLAALGVRWEGNLPSVSWANLNEDPTTVSGAPKQFSEQAFVIRNLVETDTFYMRDKNQIVNPHAARIEAYFKSVAYDFNFKFINNDHTTGDAKALVGIRARIDDASSDNKWGVRSENKINAGGATADMTTSATSTTYGIMCEYMDQLLWSVGSPSGDGVVIYANDTFLRRFAALSRRFAGSGGFSQSTDQIGRTVMKYNNAELRDAGYKADQTTRIITNTETAAGVDGASTFTSIYAVNYSPGYMSGWQFDNGIIPKDVPMETGTAKRTLIEWCGGLYSQSNRSIARIYDIKIS